MNAKRKAANKVEKHLQGIRVMGIGNVEPSKSRVLTT